MKMHSTDYLPHSLLTFPMNTHPSSIQRPSRSGTFYHFSELRRDLRLSHHFVPINTPGLTTLCAVLSVSKDYSSRRCKCFARYSRRRYNQTTQNSFYRVAERQNHLLPKSSLRYDRSGPYLSSFLQRGHWMYFQ